MDGRMNRPIVIVGAAGHATSVAETASAAGFEIVAFVDADQASVSKLGLPVLAEVPADHLAIGGALVVAISDNVARQSIAERLGVAVTPKSFPPLVHPSASVSRFAALGPGSVVLQGAVVGAGTRVGAFCIVNTRSTVDHDCTLDDFSSVAQGATLGGNCHIGTRSTVGIAATVKYGVRIDDDTVLSAHGYADGNLTS